MLILDSSYSYSFSSSIVLPMIISLGMNSLPIDFSLSNLNLKKSCLRRPKIPKPSKKNGNIKAKNVPEINLDAPFAMWNLVGGKRD